MVFCACSKRYCRSDMGRKERKEEEKRIIAEMQDAIDKVGKKEQTPTTYQPMDERKRKKIRLIVGGVCVAVFIVMFLMMR